MFRPGGRSEQRNEEEPMQRSYRRNGLAAAIAMSIFAGLASGVCAWADESALTEGKKIAFDRQKGNCLACHQMADGEYPGNIGPPLIAMQARFPDKARLRAQIWDPTISNPNSIMPPFGLHGILSEDEIDKVVEFVHSL
jgi:sulfur-oxidizing protein SoxX